MAKWYAVKTIYRLEATGRARGVDADFDPDATLFEERIVLFSAETHEKAVEEAKRDAEEYASCYSHTSRYGQKVRCRFLGEYDVFELSAKPGNEAEVYSRTQLVSKKVTDRTLGDWALGTESETERAKRAKFLEAE